MGGLRSHVGHLLKEFDHRISGRVLVWDPGFFQTVGREKRRPAGIDTSEHIGVMHGQIVGAESSNKGTGNATGVGCSQRSVVGVDVSYQIFGDVVLPVSVNR